MDHDEPGASGPLFDYIAGALAGTANIVTGYPFDTGKRAICHVVGKSSIALQDCSTPPPVQCPS